MVDLRCQVLFGARSHRRVSVAFLDRADYRCFDPRAPALDLLRSALILIAWVSYYRASRTLQLAELVTYYFVAPLFVVALSAPLLKERVGLGRWLATLLGFGGVLVAAAPGSGAPLAPVGLALLAAFSWALTTLLARSLAKGITTPALMMAGSIGFLAACGIMLPGIGVWPTLPQALAIAVLGFVGGLGPVSCGSRASATPRLRCWRPWNIPCSPTPCSGAMWCSATGRTPRTFFGAAIVLASGFHGHQPRTAPPPAGRCRLRLVYAACYAALHWGLAEEGRNGRAGGVDQHVYDQLPGLRRRPEAREARARLSLQYGGTARPRTPTSLSPSAATASCCKHCTAICKTGSRSTA